MDGGPCNRGEIEQRNVLGVVKVERAESNKGSRGSDPFAKLRNAEQILFISNTEKSF